MDKDFSLWAIGLLCSFIGALLLILLKLVLDTMKAFGVKVDAQGIQLTKIDTTLNGESGLVARFNRMHDERNRAQVKALEDAVMENAELRAQAEEHARERGGRRTTDHAD